MPASDHAHTASRRIAAGPEVIYRAFMRPEALVRWLPPDGARGAIDIFEPHVGGRLKMTLTFGSSIGKSSDNTDIVEAHFIDLTPGERIGLSVRFLSDDPRMAGTMTMTWRLEPAPAGTLVTVVADDVPSGIDRAEHEAGIASTLANLAGFVEERPAAEGRQGEAEPDRGSGRTI